MTTNEQIAHDLAIVYLVNRFGPEIDGNFNVSDGKGSGRVDTRRLPSADERTTERVGTGEHRQVLFLRWEKKIEVETDEYLVDPVFRKMIDEYRNAYSRFLQLLTLSGPAVEDDAIS